LFNDLAATYLCIFTLSWQTFPDTSQKVINIKLKKIFLLHTVFVILWALISLFICEVT
jgi:hypothetical protein